MMDGMGLGEAQGKRGSVLKRLVRHVAKSGLIFLMSVVAMTKCENHC